MSRRIDELDQNSYADFIVQQSSPVPTTPTHYQKYVIAAYAYFRSRVLIPGRCYEDESRGALAIGGAAHLDIIDLDQWMDRQNRETNDEMLDWIGGATLEQVAYWRGLGKYSASTIKRRRDKIASRMAKDIPDAKIAA